MLCNVSQLEYPAWADSLHQMLADLTDQQSKSNLDFEILLHLFRSKVDHFNRVVLKYNLLRQDETCHWGLLWLWVFHTHESWWI